MKIYLSAKHLPQMIKSKVERYTIKVGFNISIVIKIYIFAIIREFSFSMFGQNNTYDFYIILISRYAMSNLFSSD
jgi:hypothetical protein